MRMEREVCVPSQHRKGFTRVYRSEEKRANDRSTTEADALVRPCDSGRTGNRIVQRLGTESRRHIQSIEKLELSTS